MRKPKKPAFAPDGPSHPWYSLARECALELVKEASRSINPFVPPKTFRKSNFTSNLERRTEPPTVRTYPRPVFGWNEWPRKPRHDHDLYQIAPPGWCPLTPDQRRGKIVVLQVVEPTEMKHISPTYSRVFAGNLHDCCFVFDPAELAASVGLDPETEAAKQAQRDAKAARDAEVWAERQAVWKREQHERRALWDAQAAERAEAAARRIAEKAKAEQRRRRMQPWLFGLDDTDAA